MLKHKATKTSSLPVSLCKTNVISIGTNLDDEDMRKRSCTWHGIEDTNPSHNVMAMRPIERKNGQDHHQKRWETRIKMVAEETLSEKLRNMEYKHDECKNVCTSLSKVVHDRLKNLTDNEFKIIVSSFVGEIQDDGIEAASQCSWEPQKDVMVTAYFTNETLFALMNIFLAKISETLV